MESIFPYLIKHFQTDNGQENHKHLDSYLKQQHILHYWNYPRSPKKNAYIERFNRSVEEEFANYNLFTLRDNIDQFNKALKEYIHFYNNHRPHLGLKKETGQFITPIQYLKQYHQMCLPVVDGYSGLTEE